MSTNEANPKSSRIVSVVSAILGFGAGLISAPVLNRVITEPEVIVTDGTVIFPKTGGTKILAFPQDGYVELRAESSTTGKTITIELSINDEENCDTGKGYRTSETEPISATANCTIEVSAGKPYEIKIRAGDRQGDISPARLVWKMIYAKPTFSLF